YAGFDERLGNPAGYRDQGYLFLATSQAHVDYFEQTHRLQRSLGLDVRWLSAGELTAMFPQLRLDDVSGGSFCPSDGFVDPYSAMNGFAAAAVARGARIVRSAEVASIDRDGNGRVAGVKTTRGDFSAPVIVNAAGAWAAEVGRMCGIEIPVRPLKRMLIP